MQALYSIVFFLIVTTVSVNSYCFSIKCREGFVPVGDGCRIRVGRSANNDVGSCYGSNKIFINDDILEHPGPLSIDCPEGWVFDGNMECQREGWEPGSGPWETHHYIVRGRDLVLEIKRSDISVRIRSFSLDGGEK